ncbi:MAG: hypothetical protein FJW54_00250 [Actinobacteria bacterium]|nr:hypothetical protein [Actinomycetota bacterium]
MAVAARKLNLTKSLPTARTPEPILRLVQELRVNDGRPVTTTAFVSLVFGALIMSIFMVMALNMALNQDSIKLHRLKVQAQVIADQEEAITAQVARYSAPHMLAKRARVLGMVPSGTPAFLDLRPVNKP